MSDVHSLFRQLFGYTPEIEAAAPGRVNLIGEHIDYSDGFVLPFAISDRTYCAIARRQDSLVRIASAQRTSAIVAIDSKDIQPGKSGEWERYVLGVMWALEIRSGLDIVIDGRVPLGAGLSSSAALECSVATALNALFGLNKSLTDLARLTQKAETDYVGMPCGIMDQSISLMGKKGSALLLDCRDLSTRDVAFDIASAGLELLIIDTQAHHALVDGGYAERRASCESVAAKLGVKAMRDLSREVLEERKGELTPIEYQRARHAVTEIARVLDAVAALESGDFIALGKLLNASHASLRDDYTVSCPELNVAVDTALEAGALGARMVGGGFGGSAIALIKKEQQEETKAAIASAFAREGFKAPRFFTSLPSQGAVVIS